MQIFVCEIGGIPISAKGFADQRAALDYFDEQSERFTWESDPGRPKLGPGFVVREANELEAQCWRDCRSHMIREPHTIGLDMNPLLYIGVALA